MGVKWTTKVDKFPAIQAELSALSGKSVKVGCLEGSHAWLAAIHEYGCKIPVTPKMRAFLHYKGIHLKPSTTVIVIPERSFLRAGHDENIDDVMSKADKLIGDIADGTMSADELLETAGILLSSRIKEYATNLSSPPNSGLTVSMKGSANPLFDTGQMIGGITYKVE